MLVADQRRLATSMTVLQLVLDGLRRDQLAAGGLQQFLLAIGDVEEAVLIEVRDIAGAEPAVGIESTRRSPRACASSRRRPTAPRTSSSPSSANFSSTLGSGLPTAPMRWLGSELRAMTGEVSVRP